MSAIHLKHRPGDGGQRCDSVICTLKKQVHSCRTLCLSYIPRSRVLLEFFGGNIWDLLPLQWFVEWDFIYLLFVTWNVKGKMRKEKIWLTTSGLGLWDRQHSGLACTGKCCVWPNPLCFCLLTVGICCLLTASPASCVMCSLRAIVLCFPHKKIW